MTWYKMSSDSSGFLEIASDDIYKVHSNGSLSIVAVHKEDDGTYMVEISNNAGTASEKVQVEIIQTG